MKTLNRYIFKDWLKNFAMSFAMINALFLIGNLVKIQMNPLNLVIVFPNILVSMLGYSLPMGVLTATVSTVTRAKFQGELVTMAASGIKLGKVFFPLYGAGIVMTVLGFVSYEWLQPVSHKSMVRHLARMKSELIEQELNRPQVRYRTQFTHPKTGKEMSLVLNLSNYDGKRTAVVQNFEKGRLVQELFAEDAAIEVNREKKRIYLDLKRVRFFNYKESDAEDEAGRIWMKGTPFFYNDSFGRDVLNFPYEVSGGDPNHPRYMALSDMWERIRGGIGDVQKISFIFHEKVALIFTPLVFLLISLPVGMIGHHSSRLGGLLLGLGVALCVYYPLLIIGRNIAENYDKSPALLMQLPNVLLLSVGAWAAFTADRRV